ncbi:MAG: hypothetical protein KDD63_14915 [Bacteroidetes bacterium]|nr:hypothetical protein [Bacteroidota bacterium]
MKNDPIRRFVKESGLETSEEFVDLTMNRLDKQLQHRMKMKLYLLMAASVLLFTGVVGFLMYSGYSVQAFGLHFILPKIGSMIVISLIGFFVVFYLRFILNMWKGAKVELV